MESHCIRQTDIPHATRLFTDFLYHFDRVRSFYSFAPFDDQSFFRAAEALSYPEHTRVSVTGVLEEQAAVFGVTAETRRNIERLRRGAVAVVTGQQVGLFTGPMFAFYKALTAVRLANSLTERGLDCVPVFWLATEDHDLNEINHTFLLDGGNRIHRIADESAPHVPNAPVGEVLLGAEIAGHTEQAIALLPETEWKAEMAAALRDTYRPGEAFGSAFARLMSRLLGRFGIVPLDPKHPQLRRLAAGVFRRAVESADELGSSLLERNQALLKAGYHAQVHVTENSTLLFHRSEGQRIALRRRNGEFVCGDQPLSKAELLALVETHPEDFSANVLLRPVVQDSLLPTVGYVGGPAEVAYLAQVSALYNTLPGRMPVIYPRASLTLLDRQAAELMAGYQVTVQDVLAGPQILREKMSQRFLPADLAAAFDHDERRLAELLGDLRRRMETFDRTLADALDTSARKMIYQLVKIKRKAGQAAGRRSEQMEGDAALLESLIHPNKSLQERVYSGISFLARFGPGLLDRLYEQVSAHCADHQVLVL